MGHPDHETGVNLKPSATLADAVASVTDPTLIEPSPVVKPRVPTHDDLAALENIPRDHVVVPISIVRGLAALVITTVIGLGAFAIADAYERLSGDPQSQAVLTVALVTMVLAALVAIVFPRMYAAHLFADEENWDDEYLDRTDPDADDWL